MARYSYKIEFIKNEFKLFRKNIFNIFILWIIKIISIFLIIGGAIVSNRFISIILMVIGMTILTIISPIIFNFMTVPLYNISQVGKFIAIFEVFGASGLLMTFGMFGIFGVFGVFVLCGIILWTGAFFEYRAWSTFEKYLIRNQRIFPKIIGKEVKYGTKKIKDACLMMILAFFVITILFYFIFSIIGYYKLSSSLTKYNQMEQSQPYQNNIEEITNNTLTTPNETLIPLFCQICRIPLRKEDKLCPICGSKITAE